MRKFIRHIIIAITIVTLCIALSACGSSKEEEVVRNAESIVQNVKDLVDDFVKACPQEDRIYGYYFYEKYNGKPNLKFDTDGTVNITCFMGGYNSSYDCGYSKDENGLYTLNNPLLEEPVTFKIDENDSDHLILYIGEEQFELINGDLL